MNNLALHDIFIALLKQRFYCVFGENIIGAALKTTKELIFTKGMIVDRLADSFVHFDHYRTLMVKYECLIFQLHKAVSGLKNYPPKKQKLEVFLPAIMTTCQMTCHCTRSTYTPLYGVGQPLLLSNMQKPAVTSLQVTKSSRMGNYEQIAVIGSA